MNHRSFTFLAGTTLALLNVPACGARGDGNTTVVTTDSGGVVNDVGAMPIDTGVAPVDTGVAPVDTGVAPVDTGVTPTCATPRRSCGGVCVDVRTDVAHCGACSLACANGQFCSAGACRSTSECAAPRLMCGASCIDVSTDVFNCGTCNRRCGDGQTCTASRCVGGTPTCPTGTMLCGTRCIDVSGDPANCGSCGRACTSGTTCTGSSCVAIATGVASSGACSGDTCGPTGDLECTGFMGGGFCTGFCATGTTSVEADQCGGPGSTCVARPPFADVPEGQGLCMRACNPAATSETTGGCRAGQVCTGFWYNVPATASQDAPGCWAHCQTDAQCAGAVAGDASVMRCNTRTGRCTANPADLSLRFDGDPCNPAEVIATGRAACRGVCFRVGTEATQGLCGSYLNIAVGTACPDNPALIRAIAPSNDNHALCIFKNCMHNSECTSPSRCVYPESTAMIRTDLPPRCAYPTALQPNGIP